MRLIVFLMFVLALSPAAFGGLISSTELYDNYQNTTNCTEGAFTSCAFESSWANARLTVEAYASGYSYNDITAFALGKTTTTNYNFGRAWGANVFSSDSGAGWQTSDYYNLSESSWWGQAIDSAGYTNEWDGKSTQTTHTILSSLYFWSCEGPKCKQKSWWWSSDEFTYAGSGWWNARLFGEYYDSGHWSSVFSNPFTYTTGYNESEWNRWDDGIASAAETPEPSTLALCTAGLGLVLFRRFRRG